MTGGKRAKSGGVTLVEVLIASSVMIVMCLALGTLMRWGMLFWKSEQNRIGISFELRRGVHSVARELTQTRADQVQLVPADGVWYPSISFSVPQDLNGDGTVLDAAGAIEWNLSRITYSRGGLDNLQIRRTQGAAVADTGFGVTDLAFRRTFAKPSVVEIRMQVQPRNVPGEHQPQAVTLSTQVRLRN